MPPGAGTCHRGRTTPVRGHRDHDGLDLALRLVTEGLRLSGADPTRAKFMRALGRVALKTDYWPALDYRLHPLTGTGEWRFMELPALP